MTGPPRSILRPSRLLLRVRAFATLVVLLHAGVVHAASVHGTFVGGSPSAPLEGVEVVLRRAADSTVVAHTTTGADGSFRVDSLRVDRFLLRASLIGYVSLLRSDVVLTETAPDLDLGTSTLSVSPIAVKGVDVSTARPTAIVAPDRNIYLTRDMPSATTGNAADVLRSVPELDVDIDGHVSLRGSSSVTIQFNGRPAPLKGEDLANYLRQMPGSRIEKVEVIANPSAKYDPEGTAGIVNIVLKDNVDLGLSGNFSFTLGQRYSSPGTRVAWQKGKLTMFGGVSGSFNRFAYNSRTLRQSYLTAPPSTYAAAADYTYRGRYGSADASVDYALSKRTTLYGTFNAFLGASDSGAQ